MAAWTWLLRYAANTIATCLWQNYQPETVLVQPELPVVTMLLTFMPIPPLLPLAAEQSVQGVWWWSP